MSLPTPPSLAELEACIPRILPVPTDVHRPFWSVMIPTYNCAHYLRRTLASVLQQDPGPEKMQIEVVDGCSTKDDPEQVVSELGKGRVRFHRLQTNRGAPVTFNACVERSQGHWVHILHGDDMVLPGFYAAYQAMIEAHPELVMVMGKVVTIDEADNWQHLSPEGPIDTPLIRDFTKRQAVQQQGSFPTVVVQRAAYERVGGFCTYFGHASDHDMWFRVGLAGAVGRVPVAYALFRKHAGSDTNRFTASAGNVAEFVVSNLVNIARLKDAAPEVAIDFDWRRYYADYAQEWAWRLDNAGSAEGRLNQARWAWTLDPTPRRFVFLVKSWLKKILRSPGRSAPPVVDSAPPGSGGKLVVRPDSEKRGQPLETCLVRE